MIDDFLKLYGLSIEILEELSFESKLGISLKNNLHYFDKTIIMNELQEYCDWLHEYVYKREYPSSVSCKIRARYEIGEIRNIDEFKEALKQCVI